MPGGKIMILLNCDGSLTTEGTPERAAGWAEDTIEVREDLIAQQPDLLDRIFTFAFDVLDLQTIDLRIRPVSLEDYPEPGTYRGHEASSPRGQEPAFTYAM
jgi:hypothetical protein